MRLRVRFLVPFLILTGLAAASTDVRQPATASPMDDPGFGAAYAWTLLGTAVPMGVGLAWLTGPSGNGEALLLTLAGAVIGPSLGQYYAGSPLQASLALTGRLAGLGILVWGIARGMENTTCMHHRNMGDDLECAESAGGTQIVIGTLLLGGSFLYSLIDTEWSIDRARARNAARRNARLSVDPWIAYGGPLSPRIGGRAQLRF